MAAAFEVNVWDFLTVIAIALCGTFVSEGISWVLFYRTEEYQTLSKTAELQAKKLEKEKEQDTITSTRLEKKGGSGSSGGGGEATNALTGETVREKGHRVEVLEAQLKNTSRDISRLQFKSTLATSVVMITLFSYLNQQ